MACRNGGFVEYIASIAVKIADPKSSQDVVVLIYIVLCPFAGIYE